MGFKTCPKCGQTFPATAEFFYRRSNSRDGLQAWCKVCSATVSRAWRNTHKEQAAAHGRDYDKAHREQVTAVKRIYRHTHRKQAVVASRVWVHRNRKHVIEYKHQRLQANPALRLDQRLASAISESLRGCKAGRHWEDLVGYTLGDLMRHLETRFQLGMTWDNYGFYGWHIDHIRPAVTFHFESTDDPEFKTCWALSNLQPLWAKDNLSKGAKIA